MIETQFSFGTDPEFILESNNTLQSAIEVLTDVEKPQVKHGNAYYYDNVLAECTVTSGQNKQETVANIKTALQDMAELVKPYRLSKDFVAYYPDHLLLDEAALRISCRPDSCAYKMAEHVLNEDTFKKTAMRSAGGHIHLGCNTCLEEPYAVVRMLDLFLGVPSVLLENNQQAKVRREIYGKSGRYRYKPVYGIEYRSLSNFWLSSPALVELVWDICDTAINFVASGKYNDLWFIDKKRLADPKSWEDPNFSRAKCHECIGYCIDDVRNIIDTADAASAEKFMSFVEKFFTKDLTTRLNEQVKKGTPDIYKEWELT